MTRPTVLCVLFQGGSNVPPANRGIYTSEWVNRLYRGIRRECSVPFRFMCLADHQYNFDEGIQVTRLLDPDEGWMALNEVYRPDLPIPPTSQRILMGLDTVITGCVDPLMRWSSRPDEIGVVRSPMHKGALCNAVLSVNVDTANRLWRAWDRDRVAWRARCSSGLGPNQAGCASEVLFLRQAVQQLRITPKWLDDVLPIASYREHPDRWQRASILYFHGDPKPAEVAASEPRVARAWV